MEKLIKKYIIILIGILVLLLMTTNSKGFYVKEFDFSRQTLNATNIYGVCKIYRDGEVFYYRKNSTGVYTESITLSEVESIRNSIKQTVDSLSNGEYLMSKILKSDSYYDATNKEFCYKRDAASASTDLLTKVIIIGYNDEYQFKSNLTSSKGAYKVKKVGTTDEFYVSYDDSWIESELSVVYDANKIEIDKSSVELKVGETVEIKYTVLPENALTKSVSVSYSDGIEIDTTTSGVVKVKAISKGDAYIIVRLKNNTEITAKCDIKVVSETSSVTPSPIPTSMPDTPSPSPNPINENITSNKYLVDVNKKYISRVVPKVRLSEFKNNIVSNVDYKLYNRNGEIISDETIEVATGMKLKTKSQEYTMIVKGDIDGNGKITITDVVKANLYNIHVQTPGEIEEIAADINGDGKISITDVVKLKLASINLKPIE